MSFHVESHLPRFIHSLKHDIPIVSSGKGSFRKAVWYRRMDFRESRLISVAVTFIQAIDQIEKAYRYITDSNWIKAGNLLIVKLDACKSEETEKIKRIVQQRLCGLKYRSEMGKEKPLSKGEAHQLSSLAMSWKEKQVHFDVRSWQGEDQIVIDELRLRYTTFARLLLKDPKLCGRFFNWTIRDRMRVAQFILFPKTQELFDKLQVSPGFSKTGSRKLLMTNDKTRGIKCLSYPVYAIFEGRLCSKQVRVWDKNRKFQFPAGFTATLRDIYTAMRRKNKHWVKFMISENGFENWNVAEWGPTDKRGMTQPIRLEKDNWFRKIPVIERLTVEEAQRLYGPDLNGKNFGVSLRATRKNLDQDFNRAHSFFELCIPDGKGRYFTLTPGKYTRVLPTSFVELLLMLGSTKDGVVVSHDQNDLYPWRQQTRYSVVVNESDFLWFAEKIRCSIIESKKGNFPFSLIPESCSTWSQNLMNDLLEKIGRPRENFFTMSLLESDPKGLFGALIYYSKYLPRCIRKLILRFIILLLNPWRSKTVYDGDGNPSKVSVFKNLSWDELTFENPAHLFHRQINEGVLLPSSVQPEWLS